MKERLLLILVFFAMGGVFVFAADDEVELRWKNSLGDQTYRCSFTESITRIATKASDTTDGLVTVAFLKDVYFEGEKINYMDMTGYCVGVTLESLTRIKRVVFDGNGHSLNSVEPTHYTDLANTRSVVLLMPPSSTLEVRNMTINNNVVFKTGRFTYESGSQHEPYADLKFYNCTINGHYVSNIITFKTLTFDHCNFMSYHFNVIYPMADIDWSGNNGRYNFKIVLENNYVRCAGWVNTASNNWGGNKKRIDLEVRNNIIETASSAHFSVIQNTDIFGNLIFEDNTIIGDYTPNPEVAQGLVVFYGHNSSYTGTNKFYYNNDCKIWIRNNKIQCGKSSEPGSTYGMICPLAIHGDDAVVAAHKNGLQNYDNLPDNEKSRFNIGEISGNTYVHHFAAETSGKAVNEHVCKVCSLAVVTADKNNCIKTKVDEVDTDINQIHSSDVLSWNTIQDHGATQFPRKSVDVSAAKTPNGKLLTWGEQAVFTFDDGAAGGNGTKAVTASLLGAGYTSGTTWTNNTKLTAWPEFQTDSKVKVVVSDAGYTTFGSNDNVDFASIVDASGNDASGKVKAYRAKEFITKDGSSRLNFVSIAALPEDQGALVHGEAGTYWLPVLDSADPIGANGMIKGNNTGIGESDDIYVLARSASKPLGFYRLSSSTTVPYGSAYLDISGITSTSGGGSAAKAERLSFVLIDDVTGVDELIDSDCITEEGVAYNLAGSKVSNSYRGIVIRNGKKYLFK